jgi:hypothetical protein
MTPVLKKDRTLDRDLADREWEDRPRKRAVSVEPRPGRERKARALAARERGDEREVAPFVDDRGAEFVGLDPDDYHKLARAKQEELKLRKMRGELWDAGVAERRAASFFQLVKSRIEGFVARSAPGIAARSLVKEGRVVEGSLYREMQEEVRKLLDELAKMDLGEALKSTASEEEEEARDVKAFTDVEEEPMKQKVGRPRKVR